MPDGDPALAPALEARMLKQLNTWRGELLALDRRQRLLYFKHTRSASLEVTRPSLTEISALVGRGSGRLSPGSRPEDEPGVGWIPDRSGSAALLISNKTETELAAALRRLDQSSQQVYADRGFWTLYLGLGMLEWVDSDDGREVISPLVLQPVRLHRAGTQQPYLLSRAEEEAVLNPSLRLKMERDYDLELPEVDPYSIDVEKLLDEVEQATEGRDGWAVTRRAVITTFSFHKEAIYRDLTDHKSQVIAHPLVQMVALGPDAPSAGATYFDPPADDGVDELVPPEKLVSILDADASQRQCILAARDGRSFVMDGPPGTGKSQTIANIIVELISMGRSVLFVSEKAAALDVVRKRLGDAHLDPFLLELHSHAATRKQVALELDKALTQQVTAKRAFTATDEATLLDDRRKLTAYALAMNEPRSGLDSSLQAVLGQISALNELEAFSVPGEKRWASLRAAELVEMEGHARQLARTWRPALAGDDFLWRDLRRIDLDQSDVRQMVRRARAAATAAIQLHERCAAVDSDLGISRGNSVADAGRRAALLAHLALRGTTPVGWLVLPTLGAVTKRVEVLRTAVANYQRLAAELRERAGAQWQDLNPDRGPAAARLLHSNGRGISGPRRRSSELDSARNFLVSSPERLVAIADDARKLTAMFGMSNEQPSCDRAGQLAALARIGAEVALPEASWLRPGVQSALGESAAVLEHLVDVVRQRDGAMRAIFTRDALELDLAGLSTRFRDTHRGLRKFSGQARADKRELKAVTVARKVDKFALASLDEAVAWQQAERALSGGEADHAQRLGRYYRRTDTDFGRVAAAIRSAQDAIRLAGEDLNADAVARQLANDADPDPMLVMVGKRLGTNVDAWLTHADRHVPDARDRLSRMPLVDAAQWCVDSVDWLKEPSDAVRHVAGITARDSTVAEATELLRSAGQATEAAAVIFGSFEEDQAQLGPAYEGLDTNWEAVDQALAWATKARELAAGPVSPVVAEAMAAPTLTADDVRPRVAEWNAARDALTADFEHSRAVVLARDLNEDLVVAADLTSEMADSGPADIEEWCEHVEARESLQGKGFEEVLGRLVAVRSSSDQVAPAVRRAALAAWADATIKADGRLRAYRAGQRDALVEEFQDLDRRLVQEAHASVIAACSARRPRSLAGSAAQRIRREAQKKTRHIPIRSLLAETEAVALQLKPCFMMSPLSVSQFLPSDLRFDTVIFDEASQVLPSDAINCIYRASQLIVAGDQKQLPPTSFFTRAVDEEDSDDDEALDVFQSVLDLCKAAGAMRLLPLTWHYRSAHEDLITYSNYRFYGGALHTFPGARYEAADLGVHAYLVDGVYRRGGARDNPIEADKVVDRVIEHRREHPELSLGVVTFSSAQEDAVLAAIERRSATAPVLRGILDQHDRLDGFFVKNLENVQGDERDVIIFSIGYGPDEHGKFTLNFGPLNREGGWRRLNVAITRARRRVEVVASFRPEQISTTSSEGIRHLRGYLDFAYRGMPALALDLQDSLGDAESVFEEDVAQVIRGWGYEAVPQVGAAGYRIDIAVRHPDLPGAYVLAVECDGAAYHSAKTARDRDRLREEVLIRLGWRVHRIWGISWVRDRAAQMQRLREAIDAAVVSFGEAPLAVTASERGSAVEVVEADFTAPPEWAVQYERARIAPRRHDASAIESLPYLRRYFEEVLAIEAPVHEELLMRRLRDDWGIGRVGHIIRDNARRALNSARVLGAEVEWDAAGFYRLRAQQLSSVRVPMDDETTRKVGHVPPEELDLAVAYVLRDAVSAREAQVLQAVASTMGWRRQGSDIQVAVQDSLSRLLHRGDVSQAGDASYSVVKS